MTRTSAMLLLVLALAVAGCADDPAGVDRSNDPMDDDDDYEPGDTSYVDYVEVASPGR